MRQTISGLIAAIAVVAASAAPAAACGLVQSGCSPCGQTYVSPCAQSYVPAPDYSECGGCGAVSAERLPDPEQQYYYVNQGPTYTGPGNFAPTPVYREGRVYGRDAYRYHYRNYRYGYQGARIHPRFRPWRTHTGYRYGVRSSVRYGYAPRPNYAPRYSLPPRQFYAPQRSLRYGGRTVAPRAYGSRERMMDRMHRQMMDRRYN
jgi:hypothetical protein